MTVAIIGIIILLILMLMGMNIGICMMAVGFFGCLTTYMLVRGMDFSRALSASLIVFQKVPFTQATQYSFVVIPLFVLMGQLCYYSGMSAGLYNLAEKWMGSLRGGLAMATVVACALFGAICGSSAATAATMCVVALPAMREHGYDDSLSCGSIAAGGTLGILIPPSTSFILYGIITGESVGQLFAAGIVPGIILAICFCITIAIMCKVNPKLAPEAVKYPMRDKVRSLSGGLPMVVLFAVVIGGILTGFFTAVEASAIGAVLSFIYLLIRRKFSFKVLMNSLRETVKTSGMMFLILIGAYVFGQFLTATNLPNTLATFVQGLNVNRYIILIVILIIYAIMGCLMDSLPMVLLTAPIFYPIMTQTLGFNGIWYGVIMVLVMQLGLITPPVGMNVYIISGIAKDVPLQRIFKGTAPMIIGLIAAVVIVTIFPQTATWLAHFVTAA